MFSNNHSHSWWFRKICAIKVDKVMERNGKRSRRDASNSAFTLVHLAYTRHLPQETLFGNLWAVRILLDLIQFPSLSRPCDLLESTALPFVVAALVGGKIQIWAENRKKYSLANNIQYQRMFRLYCISGKTQELLSSAVFVVVLYQKH